MTSTKSLLLHHKVNFNAVYSVFVSRVAQFDLRQRRKDFSSSLCVQTGSAVYLTSCTIGTGGKARSVS
jgi:hypothetical protein